MTPNQILKILPDGLVLRRSSRADAEKLAKFNTTIHNDELVADWTLDLLSGSHPLHGEDDFTVIENTASGEIISCTCLINQTWSYAGIPFGVGRPELVGTLPAYRNRGLIRQIFDVIHAWSCERGHLMQVITGIPWYYRIFGYEMAVDLDGEGWVGYAPQVPELAEGQTEKYHFRPAQLSDVPFITAVYQHGVQRDLLACVWDEGLFAYELSKRPNNINRQMLFIIENDTSEAVGFLAIPLILFGATQYASWYELKAGVSWMDVTPSVIRFLWQTGQKRAEEKNKKCHAFGFKVYENHPIYTLLGKPISPGNQPYGWYLRVADLPAFLCHIAPALEARLNASVCQGFTGALDLNFYRSGVRMEFNTGRLEKVEPWQPSTDAWGHAAFPDLTFLQVLFGYRTWREIRRNRPDCWVEDNRQALVQALFPAHPSCLWPPS